MKKKFSKWNENFKYHPLHLTWKKNFKITNSNLKMNLISKLETLKENKRKFCRKKNSDLRNLDNKSWKITKKLWTDNLKLSIVESNNKLIPLGTRNKKNWKSPNWKSISSIRIKWNNSEKMLLWNMIERGDCSRRKGKSDCMKSRIQLKIWIWRPVINKKWEVRSMTWYKSRANSKTKSKMLRRNQMSSKQKIDSFNEK